MKSLYLLGVTSHGFQCDENCSPELFDSTETSRWFKYILPQVRRMTVGGMLNFWWAKDDSPLDVMR